MLIILTSLTLEQKLFGILSVLTRLLRMIRITTKEWFLGRHLWIQPILGFHMTSRPPCWSPVQILQELNSIIMQTFSLFSLKNMAVDHVTNNKHSCDKRVNYLFVFIWHLSVAAFPWFVFPILKVLIVLKLTGTDWKGYGLKESCGEGTPTIGWQRLSYFGWKTKVLN